MSWRDCADRIRVAAGRNRTDDQVADIFEAEAGIDQQECRAQAQHIVREQVVWVRQWQLQHRGTFVIHHAPPSSDDHAQPPHEGHERGVDEGVGGGARSQQLDALGVVGRPVAAPRFYGRHHFNIRRNLKLFTSLIFNNVLIEGVKHISSHVIDADTTG